MARDERLAGFAKDLKDRFQYMAICRPEPVTVDGLECSRLVPFEILLGEGEEIPGFVFLAGKRFSLGKEFPIVLLMYGGKEKKITKIVFRIEDYDSKIESNELIDGRSVSINELREALGKMVSKKDSSLRKK